jgi:ATP-dependent Clp protease ATP-binding subunit ClpC
VGWSGRNLTQLAREGKLLPVTAWTDEIERLIRILSCHTRNNAFLVGPRGFCRTAVVEGLAQFLSTRDVPAWLKDRQILDGGNNWRSHPWLVGMLQGAPGGKLILFLDDLPLSGLADGVLSVLSHALAQGQMRLIGAATPEEYRRYLERDGSLERWIQPVHIRPPSRSEVVMVLRQLRPVYEGQHGVRLPDEALEAAAELADRHLGGSQPDKAVDLLDEAAVVVRLKTQTCPAEIQDLAAQIERLNGQKESAVAEQDFDRAAGLRDQADRLKRRREALVREWRDRVQGQSNQVGSEVVAEVVKQRLAAGSGATA